MGINESCCASSEPTGNFKLHLIGTIMTRLRKYKHGHILSLLSLVYLTSCASPQKDLIPFAPVDWVIEAGGVVRRSLPIHLHHERFRLDSFRADGTMQLATYDELLFPVDVYLVYYSDTQIARAFLGRSPHGGCLLTYVADKSVFEDPCYGSRFDLTGAYQVGPAQRGLDQLPAEVHDQMIWVKNELIHGEEHP